MSVLLGTNRANNLFVLLDMANPLALAFAMGSLYMLIKVVFLLERARAMWADPRFRN